MSDPILPDNDIDLQLARKLGDLLAEPAHRWQAGSSDPLLRALGTYKASLQAAPPTISETVSNRLWNEIYHKTRPAEHAKLPKPHARIFTLNSSFTRIAIAASLLIAIALTWMLFIQAPQPELLAESDSQIETVTLADGSTITLRPHSRLYKDPDVSDNGYKLEGEGFFDVTHNPSRTFTVVAGNAQVTVLGTRFNINSWQSQTQVYLQEGRVALTHIQSQESIELSPGQLGTVEQNQVVRSDEPALENGHLDWLNNEIVFSGSSLADVVAELEFHFDITIEIPAGRASETLSGSIGLESPDFVLDGLSFVMQGGTFTQTAQNSYQFVEE